MTFVAQYKERTGLLLSNGIIYTSWASNCDGGSYNGWVMGYSESNLSQVVLNMTPNGERRRPFGNLAPGLRPTRAATSIS